MTLPIDKWYEFVFLSQHLIGPQLGEKAVAKVVKSANNTVQYWLKRWKASKDVSDMERPGSPRATTEKVDQQIYKLTGSEKYCYNRRYTKCFDAAKHRN